MSVLATTQVPKPADEQAFERASLVLWREILRDPNVQRNGRRGQSQNGVDLFGYRDRATSRLVGIQCKLKGPRQVLTEAEVRREVAKALTFKPPLTEYFITTTAPDDADLQRVARELVADLEAAGRSMKIAVWGWETLQDRIAEHPDAGKVFDPSFTPFGEKLAKDQAASFEQQVAADKRTDAQMSEMSASLTAAVETGHRIEAFLTSNMDSTSGAQAIEVHLDAEIDTTRDLVAKTDPAKAIGIFERQLDRVEANASGRIVFRIKANIGICHFVLGDDETAATFLETAYGHAPDQPRAIANMALAMLLRKETRRLREYAASELAKHPDNDQLAALLIQGVKNDADITEPLDLLPEQARGGAAVAIARVEFLRVRRTGAEWWPAAKATRDAFPTEPYARQFAAEAVIDELLRLPAIDGVGVFSGELRRSIEEAVEILIERLREVIDGNVGIRPEHVGLCCNIVSSLLALGDVTRAADFVRRGRQYAPHDGDLATRAVLIGLEIGDQALIDDALPALPAGPDADLCRFRLCASNSDWQGLIALDGKEVPESERGMVQTAVSLARIRLTAPNGLDIDALRAAIEEAASDPRASVLAAQTAMHFGQGELAEHAHRNAVSVLGDEPHRAARAMVARLSAVRGDWASVIGALNAHVDPTRNTEELRLLAAGHVNVRPIRQGSSAFFERLAPDIGALPTFLQARGLMEFNRGALDDAETYLRQALAAEPDLRSLLALTATLRRVGRSNEIPAALEPLDVARLEGEPSEQIAACHELLRAGRAEEAFRFGYRVLKEAPNDPKVAQRYMGLAFSDSAGEHMPAMPAIATDAWFRLESDSNETFEAVVEDDEQLRDKDDVPRDHPLIAAAQGLSVGDTFERKSPLGTTTWKVVEVKHKVVHALHVVTNTFGTRFPDEQGFFKILIVEKDFSTVLHQVKQASDATRAVADLYLEKKLPLSCVSGRSPQGTIGLANYLLSIDADITTAVGTEPERMEARATILRRRHNGAALDTLTAWTASSLGVLDTLKTLFGDLSVPRSVIDEIRSLADQSPGPKGGMRVGWRDGDFTRRDYRPEDVREFNAEFERIISDIEAHCRVEPVVAPDLPSDLAMIITGAFGTNVLDAAFLALAKNAILISQDLHFRVLAAEAVGVTASAWLQVCLMVARERKLITSPAYSDAVIGLAARHHGHVTFEPDMLAGYVAADDQQLERLTIASRYIAGANADMNAHMNVILQVLGTWWTGPCPGLKAMRATSLLIDRFVRERPTMRSHLLGILRMNTMRDLRRFIEGWAIGHMIPLETLINTSAANAASVAPRTTGADRRRRRARQDR